MAGCARWSRYHPCGARSVAQAPSLYLPQLPGKCRLWANKARFQVKYTKVSQNDEVSPKSVHEACHSPYSQNGLQKSALGFLGFLYSLAFSHKELMGGF